MLLRNASSVLLCASWDGGPGEGAWRGVGEVASSVAIVIWHSFGAGALCDATQVIVVRRWGTG